MHLGQIYFIRWFTGFTDLGLGEGGGGDEKNK